jgi:hypothetical protein
VKACLLCGRIEGRIEGHHLSYDPEIVIDLCKRCHNFVHYFPYYSEDQIQKVREWVKSFSYQWQNGTQKYLKSHYAKKVRQEFRQRYYQEIEIPNDSQRKYRHANLEKIHQRQRIWMRNRRKNPEFKAKERIYKKAYMTLYNEMHREEINRKAAMKRAQKKELKFIESWKLNPQLSLLN